MQYKKFNKGNIVEDYAGNAQVVLKMFEDGTFLCKGFYNGKINTYATICHRFKAESKSEYLKQRALDIKIGLDGSVYDKDLFHNFALVSGTCEDSQEVDLLWSEFLPIPNAKTKRKECFNMLISFIDEKLSQIEKELLN